MILYQANDNDFFQKLAMAACQKTISAPQGQVMHRRQSGKALLDTLDEQLNRGNILEMSYFASVLSNQYSYSDGRHSSVIVGRRFNDKTGTCQFLIRNSWGTGCGYYDDSYECDQGNVWIPEDKIAEVGSSTTYLQ